MKMVNVVGGLQLRLRDNSRAECLQSVVVEQLNLQLMLCDKAARTDKLTVLLTNNDA